MIVGKTTVGSESFTLDADEIRAARFMFAQPGKLAKLTAWLDGEQAAVGLAQQVRAVMLTQTEELLGASEDVTIFGDQEAGWVDFNFEDPVEFDAGLHLLGLHAGTTASVATAYGDDPAGRGGVTDSAAFASGAPSELPSSSPETSDLTIFATVFTPWVPAADQSEFAYARLPFSESQVKLAETQPSTRRYNRVECGWHGTIFDPEDEAFCVVQFGGVLDALIGERLRITRRDRGFNRSVVALCEGDAIIDEDISLTRRLFIALGLPSLDSITVKVEVLE